jgi:Flp pilus assembly protein TadD
MFPVKIGRRWLGTALLLIALIGSAAAGDVRISIPKRTKPTLVQKLNQEGVKAAEKHEYKKAKNLFYKAYLIDPNDPFTLNNLGYIAELEGQVDRAQRYYALAQDQNSDAVVYKSTEKAAIGKPVDKIAGDAADAKMQINRINVYAMNLLQKERAPEADLALQKALKMEPNNPFTLNNLGYAKEEEGELEEAYRYYSQAANQHSTTSIVVTVRPQWRGKGISDVAGQNAEKVRSVMSREQDTGAQVARLNTRGVAAINRNDYKLARQYFEQAYKLDPKNAFALNNMGYLSEMDGDRETADYYYAKAREADQSSMKVAYATRKDVEGMKLAAVAGDSDDAVNKATEEAAALRRAQGGPVVLRYRNDQPVVEPATPPPPPAETSNSAPANPAPSSNPAPAGNNGLLEPLPDNEQPGSAQPPAEQAPSQQPPVVHRPPQSQQPQGPFVHRPPQSDQQSAPPVANPSGGLLMPLPDDQQPPATQPQQQQPPQ